MSLLRTSCLATSLALIIACAGKRAASSACDPVAGDAGFAGVVYRECAVDRAAAPPQTEPPLDYTPAVRSGCRRATIEVVVDTEGRLIPATARVVRSDDAAFSEAILRSLPLLKYRPAMKNGVAVPQLVRIERMFQVMTVAVPAGSGPPGRPPRQSVPRC